MNQKLTGVALREQLYLTQLESICTVNIFFTAALKYAVANQEIQSSAVFKAQIYPNAVLKHEEKQSWFPRAKLSVCRGAALCCQTLQWLKPRGQHKSAVCFGQDHSLLENLACIYSTSAGKRVETQWEHKGF